MGVPRAEPPRLAPGVAVGAARAAAAARRAPVRRRVLLLHLGVVVGRRRREVPRRPVVRAPLVVPPLRLRARVLLPVPVRLARRRPGEAGGDVPASPAGPGAGAGTGAGRRAGTVLRARGEEGPARGDVGAVVLPVPAPPRAAGRAEGLGPPPEGQGPPPDTRSGPGPRVVSIPVPASLPCPLTPTLSAGVGVAGCPRTGPAIPSLPRTELRGSFPLPSSGSKLGRGSLPE